MRPDVLTGKTYGCRTAERYEVYITLNTFEGKLHEVFVRSGQFESEISILADVLGKLISRLLQAAVSPETIAESLEIKGGQVYGTFRGQNYGSLPMLVALVIKDFLKEKLNAKQPFTIEQARLDSPD